MKISRSASIYFALQGLAVLAWWPVLYLVPASRAFFRMGEGDTILLAFWLPDLFLLGAGSLVASVFCRTEGKLMVVTVWFVVGAISYATIYCLAFAWMTDTGWLGVALMFPAMILSGNFAVGLSPAFVEGMFRRSADGKTGWILAKTLAQIVVVWTLILFVFPPLVVQIETKLGLSQFTFPLQKTVAVVFFVLISFFGISGAYLMAKIGRGTPLPMDSASKLVVAGIYGYVRNPMAVSGIGQGLAVGLYWGSPFVLLYALLGGAVWQLIFRPLEEDDLLARFGPDYEDYRKNVRCWIPRLKPYRTRPS